MSGAMTQLSLFCLTRLLPQRHDAQALLLSAWQFILQHFLSEILALQVEFATVQGAACRLDLIRPDLWCTMRHFPRPLDITGLGRQFHFICCCNVLTMFYVLRRLGTTRFTAAYHMLGTLYVLGWL